MSMTVAQGLSKLAPENNGTSFEVVPVRKLLVTATGNFSRPIY